MAITAAELQKKLSINTGPGNSTAQANPNDSIGGFMSTTQITNATLNNLFDDVSGDENAALEAEYRCFFIHNTHASLTWQSPKVWVSSQVAGGADVAIALDGTGVVAAGLTTAQAERIANENTAPTGEAFSTPTTKATGLAVANVGPGQCFAIWVRRTTTNSAALNNDGAIVEYSGDTAA